MKTRLLPHPTVEEYLAGEQDGEVRHDYIDGCIYAMTGASAKHNRISLNTASLLLQRARSVPCEVFMADMKVHIRDWNAFYYPDVMVCCDPADDAAYYRERPCLIVEVLSPGTAGVDRREKLASYRRLASLKEYILVEQERRAVEVYRREAGHWKFDELGPGDELWIDCLDMRIPVRELYEGIEINPSPGRL
ncbi:MAG: Uma2 family endonuclease [Gammaproteobacteria bacterium]|nr:Uma2 family endonuclease [Gammaproteobacteria bacterium]MBU1656177.1 Uma2 family endonuclease [Gammaproteobacteria bacterium]MBU1961310.1 Uma2 family endonuclease [Gammaproteobacteria bacterium]